VLDHLIGCRDVDVAVDVDAEIAPPAAIATRTAAAGGRTGTREEHRSPPGPLPGRLILRHNPLLRRLPRKERVMAKKKKTTGSKSTRKTSPARKARAGKARVRDLSLRKGDLAGGGQLGYGTGFSGSVVKKAP
jgi:hypothetical protein